MVSPVAVLRRGEKFTGGRHARWHWRWHGERRAANSSDVIITIFKVNVRSYHYGVEKRSRGIFYARRRQLSCIKERLAAHRNICRRLVSRLSPVPRYDVVYKYSS